MSDTLEIKNGVLVKYRGLGGDIVIPEGVTSIGDRAFSDSAVCGITIPRSVTSIGNASFFSCALLTSVEIPDSVLSIGKWAFGDCENLTCSIPSSVTSIKEAAFVHIRWLILADGNPKYRMEGKCLIENETQTLLWGNELGTIPNGVRSIAAYAFAYNDSITRIAIPDSVQSIGTEAFIGCTSLTSVSIPKECELGRNVFPEDCKVTRRES